LFIRQAAHADACPGPKSCRQVIPLNPCCTCKMQHAHFLLYRYQAFIIRLYVPFDLDYFFLANGHTEVSGQYKKKRFSLEVGLRLFYA